MPDELVGETLLELRQRFGAVSSETQMIQGQWEHEGQTYFDDLLRVFADVPDEPAHREFFKNYKAVLIDRFKQIDIWITTHPIEIV